MAAARPGRVAFLNTVPCDDCGEAIDWIRQPWYPMPSDGALCRTCGEARGLAGVMPASAGPSTSREDV